VLKRRIKKNRKPFHPTTGVVIGLTGGIGSGKSFILKCFERLGFKIFDTDKAVHELMKKGNEGYIKIANIFPSVVGIKGISRTKLLKLILKDKSNLVKLEKILHPLVRKAQQKFAAENKKYSVVFEVPLLFENNREDYYDYVVASVVDQKTQKERVMKRKGMTEGKFNAIMGKQVSNLVRQKRADFIIDTNCSKRAVFTQIKELLENV